MFGFINRFRRPQKNSLYFAGDGDDIDIIIDIERTFEIEITDDEAETILNVGDLQDLLLSKLSSNDPDLLWKLICRIAVDHAGRSIDAKAIDRHTTFFVK